MLCIYYASTEHLETLQELWVRTSVDNYIPVHEITAALGPSVPALYTFLVEETQRVHHIIPERKHG